jgi:hypothetical protein
MKKQKSNLTKIVKNAKNDIDIPVAQTYGQYHILKGYGYNPVRCQFIGYAALDTNNNDEAMLYFQNKNL